MGQIQKRKTIPNSLKGGFQPSISKRNVVSFTYMNLPGDTSETHV